MVSVEGISVCNDTEKLENDTENWTLYANGQYQ